MKIIAVPHICKLFQWTYSWFYWPMKFCAAHPYKSLICIHENKFSRPPMRWIGEMLLFYLWSHKRHYFHSGTHVIIFVLGYILFSWEYSWNFLSSRYLANIYIFEFCMHISNNDRNKNNSIYCKKNGKLKIHRHIV